MAPTRDAILPMWKLNLVIEQFYSQQLSIDHAKSLTKVTENGAKH